MTMRSPLAAYAQMSKALRPKPLTQLEAAARGVETMSPQAAKSLQAGIKGRPPSGEVNAPAYEVSDTFTFQSFFDTTLEEQAILAQPTNQQIVPSTLSDPIQTAGYGVGLLPSSETPIAIQFSTGGQQGRSATYRLKPGEVIWPYGRPNGIGHNGQFSGFQWGLPFGWLGGGSATLVVLRTADAKVTWASDHSEVVYHRIRLTINTFAQINALITAGAYNGPANWPQRFPWPLAISGVTGSSLNQGGQPAVAVAPTRTAMKLNLPTLAAPTDMRMYFVGTDNWAQLSTGAIDLTNIVFSDITWGSWTPNPGVNAPFNAANETEVLTGEAALYAANAGAVVLGVTNDVNDAALLGATVDFTRYGRI